MDSISEHKNIFLGTIIAIIISGIGVSVSYSGNEDKPFYVDNPYFEGKHAFKVEEVRNFFNEIKADVESRDIESLGAKVFYPVKVKIEGNQVILRNSDDLKTNYKQLFNSDIRNATRCQKFDNLFASWRGVMIGGGAIWFSKVDISKLRETDDYGVKPAPLTNNNRNPKWEYKITHIGGGKTVKQFLKFNRCESLD